MALIGEIEWAWDWAGESVDVGFERRLRPNTLLPLRNGVERLEGSCRSHIVKEIRKKIK
jgi:hypothetical protein